MKGWRTIGFNLVVGILPIFEMTEVIDLIPEAYVGPYMIGVAVANVLLRVITTTPVGKSS